jgi:pimeloyl-ACP methyl ester carboxylesterase
VKADFLEAGAGPLVMLVHSSMSGARQWTALMNVLQDRFRVRAVNLFGERIAVVGHSFGGAVAMAACRRLGDRVEKLVLIEPSLFSLLSLAGRHEAFAEISAVAASMRHGTREEAAERFVGYWTGRDAWERTSPERRAAYARMVDLVLFEWTVLEGNTPVEAWADALPRRTLLLSAKDTKRPSREMVELLLHACPHWALAGVPEGGHLAPLARPDLVNPIVAAFLDERQPSQ